ncbi:DUF742 domain-containing protein [Streptomyces clavuligerus]|uniref:DUF742 domain-containing protein n=1 Tax=Streptomyces clavuligerus TaxID=1901 RepID=E2PZ63_STRCL|nr:DUF742 domain-containing protein [Streptomyces clavuligerus]ANW17210.1 multi-component regulatory system-3 [Streptomyces clavuligerus]AXU11749.1 DUF742 domain-containing protein [Streptomyces clavuligerus]EFG10324.1 DUF742 domain-containing protein [Streptomyces clavuligerus]MBY6301588.1 DUF742 domain-containing protein [Streptomyces clavuligerus]QCS04530.1 DUF742 domain-containing protein [Streptomyces clavuligerus]
MPAPDRPLVDDEAGRIVRPYTASGGRTRPTAPLDLLSLVTATGRAPARALGPEHALALGLCARPVSVAEVSAHLGLPAAVTKVLLSDLVDCGAVVARAPRSPVPPTDRSLLEAVLDGLRQRL